jgi:hypothetical protein
MESWVYLCKKIETNISGTRAQYPIIDKGEKTKQTFCTLRRLHLEFLAWIKDCSRVPISVQ